MIQIQNEPAAASGLGAGLSTLLIDPLRDVLLEIGASDRLASAVTKLLLIALPILAALYTRSRTVSKAEHNVVVNEALLMPPDATRADLRHSLEMKAVVVASAAADKAAD